MPVRIRLATNGAARNVSVAESIPLLLRLRRSANLTQCGYQQVDVVVEQLEIIGHFLDTADRRRHHEDVRTGGPSDGVWRSEIEVGLHENELHVLPLHLHDQVERVLR